MVKYLGTIVSVLLALLTLPVAAQTRSGGYQIPLASGIPTWLETPLSANLAAAMTDETGSGLLVFNNNPTLIGATLTGPLALGTQTISGGFTISGVPILPGISTGTIVAGGNLGLDATNHLVKSTISSVTPAGSTGDIQINSSGSLGALTPASGVSTFIATPTSANLAAAVTNETGSGALVFATSPTLVTPILGTPTSATLTNATGLPIAGLTGLGTNIGTYLGSATFANWAATVGAQTANTFPAGPASGSAANMIVRALVAADLPGLTDTSKTGNYTVVAGDMANALNLGGSGSTTLTLPTASSTIFAPGMTLSINTRSATGNWTLTNSTGLTYTGPTTLVPGTQGTLVANVDAATLDFFGFTTPAVAILGGVFSKTCSAGDFVSTIATTGAITCATPSGSGNVTAAGTLANNAIAIGQGTTALATTTTGTGVLTALGVNVGSAGAFVTFNGAGGTPSSLTLTNATGLPQTGLAPSTFATGTTHTFVAPAEIWECTGTCTVTPPTPAAGYQFCVRNANNVATVITLAAIASVSYENTNFTSYKSTNTAIVSGGAAGDKMCIIGKDSTHYDVMSYNGTWS